MNEKDMRKPVYQELFNRFFEDIEEQRIRDLVKVKNIYRKIHSGGCKMHSQGFDCNCFLCQVDSLISGIKKGKE